MNEPPFGLHDLTVQEALLFAFRYRLIDDCRPEGAKVRLILGNQSLLFTQDELPVFLYDLLRGYERAVLLTDKDDPARIVH